MSRKDKHFWDEYHETRRSCQRWGCFLIIMILILLAIVIFVP